MENIKNLDFFLRKTHNNINYRERIEWLNFWYSDANQINTGEKILFVGDSTARMVRRALEEYVHVPVDMIGTSCGLHDIMLVKQLEAFFYTQSYRYSTIFVQLGQHANTGIYNEKEFGKLDFDDYYSDYSALIHYLQQFCQNIIIVSVFYRTKNSFPIIYQFLRHLKFRIIKETLDKDFNRIIEGKNEIARRIAYENSLNFCDINAYMLEKMRHFPTRYYHTDGIHFEGPAKIIIAMEYQKYVK